MRIVAGTLGGRTITAPKGATTRPTSDRVREALFSRLEALDDGALVDGSVLDAFAGSGALGIEALSRGAASATFVERDRAALTALRRNIDALGIASRTRVTPADLFVLARRTPPPGHPFSLLFLDPPYRINKSEVRQVVERLAATNALSPGALVVWEHATGEPPEWPPGFESLGPRRYGDTTIEIARWRGEGTG